MAKQSKKKQEETLERMKETRYEDMIFLREVAKQKFKWAEEERQKGLDQIKKYEEAIENTKKTVTRLYGYMVACKELFEAKPEKPNKEEKK